jgi:hypothetical protein
MEDFKKGRNETAKVLKVITLCQLKNLERSVLQKLIYSQEIKPKQISKLLKSGLA